MPDKMQTFWNRVSQCITNPFDATNILGLSAEPCLGPMSIYAEQTTLMTAVRIVTAIPENNVVSAMLPQSFPLKREPRLETNRRLAFDMNKGSMRPKVWSSTCTTTFQTRLPVDEIAATPLKVIAEGQRPMRRTRLLQVTSQEAERHFNTKETVRKMMHQKWVDKLYPQYSEYRPLYRGILELHDSPQIRGWMGTSNESEQKLHKRLN